MAQESTVAAPERRRLAFCQSGYYSAHWQRCHHLGLAAVRAGWDVTFVVPTNSFALALWRHLRARDQARLPFSFRHLRTLLPARLQRRWPSLGRWARASMERQVLALREEFADALVIVEDHNFPASVLQWRRAALVYDVVDDFLHMDGPAARERELLFAAEADAVVVSARGLAPAFEHCRAPLTCIPNGADPLHYRSALSVPRTERRTVFMGTLGKWVDRDLLVAVAERLPDWEFVLVGAAAAGWLDAVSWPGNVRYNGRIGYGELPAVLSRCSVGLIPFDAASPVARAADPLKLYEYPGGGPDGGGHAVAAVGAVRAARRPVPGAGRGRVCRGAGGGFRGSRRRRRPSAGAGRGGAEQLGRALGGVRAVRRGGAQQQHG